MGDTLSFILRLQLYFKGLTMKKYLGTIFAIVISNLSFANDINIEAERLLELSGSAKAISQMTEIMLQAQLQAKPELKPYENDMRRFFAKYLSMDYLGKDLVAIYTEAFTQEELEAINSFYASKVGQKTVRLMPELMKKQSDLGVKAVMDNIDELLVVVEEKASTIPSSQ